MLKCALLQQVVKYLTQKEYGISCSKTLQVQYAKNLWMQTANCEPISCIDFDLDAYNSTEIVNCSNLILDQDLKPKDCIKFMAVQLT